MAAFATLASTITKRKFNKTMKKDLLYTIVKAGIVVGSLDILAAFIQYFILTGDKNVYTILT